MTPSDSPLITTLPLAMRHRLSPRPVEVRAGKRLVITARLPQLIFESLPDSRMFRLTLPSRGLLPPRTPLPRPNIANITRCANDP